jgi:hypothetical protein
LIGNKAIEEAAALLHQTDKNEVESQKERALWQEGTMFVIIKIRPL